MKFVRFVFGFMMGAALGWLAGTLLAPESGEGLRQTVRDRMNQIAEEGRSAAEQRVGELRAEFEEAKKPRPASTT